MVETFTTHIVSHYRADREAILDTVLAAMADWRNCLIDATITSNTDRYAAGGFLAPWQARFEQAGHRLRLEVVDDLANPRMLTWAHKRHVGDWAAAASPGEDFFVYIEDDLRLTDANMRYFVRARRALRRHGLIPGFVRYETKDNRRLLVDVNSPEYWQRDRNVTIDGTTYHANRNPYWAGYILDRQLAFEYLESRSFDPVTSAEVSPWNIQERSAMGLTYENPPKRLGSRVVIPLIAGRPAEDCMIWHCSNSYSAAGHPVVAAHDADEIYRTETGLERLRRRARSALARFAK